MFVAQTHTFTLRTHTFFHCVDEDDGDKIVRMEGKERKGGKENTEREKEHTQTYTHTQREL